LQGDDKFDAEFSNKCKGYAVACHLKLRKQNGDHTTTTTTTNDLTLGAAPRKPKFEGRLIPIPDDNNATRYSSAVYPWNAKMLRALGVQPCNYDSIASPSVDRKHLCNKALEHLLTQTEECRSKYASVFEELLIEESNSKFVTMKLLLDNELHGSANE